MTALAARYHVWPGEMPLERRRTRAAMRFALVRARPGSPIWFRAGNAGIRHAAQPPAPAPAPADQPLELSLRGACALAVAIANQDGVEAAANALPPTVRSRCTSADGRADAAFVKLYELLRETRPEI